MHDVAPGKTVSLNDLAFSATVHCLTGCAIGEVLGLVFGTALGWGNTASVALAVVLAFFIGYLLTLLPLLAEGIRFGTALSLAFASDTLSIVVMEIVDNAVVLAVPGAMTAGPSDILFWASLALSLVVAFVVAFPVNRWLIRRGRGHALVHVSQDEAAWLGSEAWTSTGAMKN
jgi:hypothetical protein